MKFRLLKILSGLFTLVGLPCIALGIGVVLFSAATGIAIAIGGIVMVTTGELITLLLAIEHNTRRSAAAMETLIKRRRKTS